MEIEAELADFVEEEGAVARGADQADVVAVGAGEGAAAVAEELALEEIAGDRGAVEGDEGVLRAVGEVMNGAGEDFLAGAAFARNRPVAADGGSRLICRGITVLGSGSVRDRKQTCRSKR